MSVPYGAPAALEQPVPSAAPSRRPDPAAARAALAVAVGLAAGGALLGLLWSWWSPPGPAAEVLGGGRYAVIEESESAIAGDGRYLVIVAAVGLVAALAAWFGLRATRGATLLAGLCVGAAGGALLTELVGHLTGGGSFSGRLYNLSDGTRQEVTLHLPLSLHLSGLVLIEPVMVVLVYGLLVAFTAHDDLGRPDPVRDLVAARGPAAYPAAYPSPSYPPQGYPQEPYAPQGYPQEPYPQQGYPPQAYSPTPPGSVHPGHDPQHGGGYGDAAGSAQQGDLPPQ